MPLTRAGVSSSPCLQHRLARRWSRFRLAKEAGGISATTIQYIELYDHTPIPEIQIRLAEALNTTVRELFPHSDAELPLC